MKTIIEIESYGDLGMKYTDSIFVSDEAHDVAFLKSEFCSIIGVKSIDTLPSNMVRDTIETFKMFLAKNGFKQLKTTKVVISD